MADGEPMALKAVMLAVGDRVYARGEWLKVTHIDYSTPVAGTLTVTFENGQKLPVGAAQKVSVERA